MAVVNLKSPSITDRDAQPPVLDTAGYAGSPGRLIEVYDQIPSVTASASVLSQVRLVSVPSNAVISSVQFWSGAQTAGTFSVGWYRSTKDGGLVVFGTVGAGTGSDALYTGSTGISAASAVYGTELVFGAIALAGAGIVGMAQPLWQVCGLAADPIALFDLVCTVFSVAVTTGTAPLGVRVRYKL